MLDGIATQDRTADALQSIAVASTIVRVESVIGTKVRVVRHTASALDRCVSVIVTAVEPKVAFAV